MEEKSTITTSNKNSQQQNDTVDYLKLLLSQVKTIRKYDVNIWMTLLQKSKEATDFSHSFQNEIFEEALKQYPTSLPIWRQFIELELFYFEQEPVSESSIAKLSDIFERAASSTMSPQIWEHYLTWKLKNAQVPLNSIYDLYEFAIKNVGYDISSINLWTSYVKFIKDTKPENQFEEQLRLDNLRKLYQRAVVIPITGIEGLWKEYDSFENSLNKITGRKILSDKSGLYMNARTSLKELRSLYDGKINKSQIVNYWISRPKDKEQLAAWLALLEWERKNFLSLSQENLHDRLCFVFKSTLAHIRSSEQIWYLYFSYLYEHEKKSHSQADFKHILKDSILKTTLLEAIEYLPFSLILHSALLEVYEELGEVDEGKSLIETLLLRYISYIDETSNLLEDECDQEMAFIVQERIDKIKSDHCTFFKSAIRFGRRTQGLPLARQYFAKARKLEYCHYDLYVLSANMEFFIGKDSGVAFKIYELGMKLYSGIPEYIISYMKLLLIKLDESNIKSLFERALVSLAGRSQAIKELWEMLIEHERDLGHFVRLQELCHRQIEEFPEGTVQTLFLVGDSWTSLLNRLEIADFAHEKVVEKKAIESRKRPYTVEFSSADLLKSVIISSGPVSLYKGPIIPVEIAMEMFKAVKLPQ